LRNDDSFGECLSGLLATLFALDRLFQLTADSRDYARNLFVEALPRVFPVLGSMLLDMTLNFGSERVYPLLRCGLLIAGQLPPFELTASIDEFLLLGESLFFRALNLGVRVLGREGDRLLGLSGMNVGNGLLIEYRIFYVSIRPGRGLRLLRGLTHQLLLHLTLNLLRNIASPLILNLAFDAFVKGAFISKAHGEGVRICHLTLKGRGLRLLLLRVRLPCLGGRNVTLTL
jgi:hypothetical protein